MEVYKYKYSIHFCILYTSNCFRRHLLLESGIIKHARSHDPPVLYARAGCVCVCAHGWCDPSVAKVEWQPVKTSHSHLHTKF